MTRNVESLAQRILAKPGREMAAHHVLLEPPCAPPADGIVQVTAADPSSVGTAALVLATNDPNNPSLAVALDPSVDGQTDTTPAHEPSGGCNAGGAGSGVLLVGCMLGYLARPKRRRSAINSHSVRARATH